MTIKKAEQYKNKNGRPDTLNLNYNIQDRHNGVKH